MTETVQIGDMTIGGGGPLALIAGPCVLEDEATTLHIARALKEITDELALPFLFKASYDKANRSSLQSYRGPGPAAGLRILQTIKNRLGVKLLSDVHLPEEVEPAAEVLDVLQIPALLCRQTDFILRVAATGRPVNIKKGQFLAPWDVGNIVDKVVSTGNHHILLTERGHMFGYNNLVVDFRSIPIMQQQTGKPVIFDATHSVQLPGGEGGHSGGQREFAPVLARAAVAAGADGIFMEVHPDPDKALCDGPNSLYLDTVYVLLQELQAIRNVLH